MMQHIKLGKTRKPTPAPMVIPRYAGSKRLSFRLFTDGINPSTLVEPFAGGGSLSAKLAQTRNAVIFAADLNPAVQSVWQTWTTPENHPSIKDHLDNLLTRITNELLDYGDPVTPALTRVIEDETSNTRSTRQALIKAMKSTGCKGWQLIPNTWSVIKDAYEAGDTGDLNYLAAITLMLHKLSFGGVIRSGKIADNLNIAPSIDQMGVLWGWEHRYPTAPAFLSFSGSWEGAVTAFEASTQVDALAVIDPPYYWPVRGEMTPAYRWHTPWADETLALTLDCAGAMAKSRKLSRIVVTNYLSDPVDQAMTGLAAEHNWYLTRVDLGRLDGLNRSKACTSDRRDTAWIFNRDRPQVADQLCLFT
jgi:hypothetical protein